MCSLVCFMKKPQITVRLSPFLLAELDQYVQNSGTSKTDVVVSAIAQYIGCNEGVRLNQRVAELERRVAMVESKLEAK